jgi:DinB superfamily
MNKRNFLLVCMIILTTATFAHSQTEEDAPPRRTNAQIVDYILTIQERRVVEIAELIPENKYCFTPRGEGFAGVRNLGEQLRHIAADNYLLGAGMLLEKPPVDMGPGEDGSLSVHTKAQIVDYLKNSFAYMHRAVAAIDDANEVIPTPHISPWPRGTATRLGIALEDCVHTWDHYGQLVEYLRMNNIIPPESRK